MNSSSARLGTRWTPGVAISRRATRVVSRHRAQTCAAITARVTACIRFLRAPSLLLGTVMIAIA